MLDELKSMAVFCKVVECHSFAKAAVELNLSPSVISHHVSLLEKKTGVALLYRSTRRLAVTNEGEKLYRECHAMVQAASRGLSYLSHKSDVPQGRLKICMAQVLVQSPIMEGIARFVKEYPGVHLKIDMSDKVQNIIEGGYDLAIRIGTLKDSNLKMQKIYEIKRMLVASPQFISDFGMPKTITECLSYPFISPSMLAPIRTFVKANQKEKIEFIPRVEVDSVDAAYQFALKGLGLTTSPDYLVSKDLSLKHLIHILPEWVCEGLKVYALVPSNTYENSLSQLLKNTLVNHLNVSANKNILSKEAI